MDVETAIRTRRTHKAFRPEPVPREQLDELFDLAMDDGTASWWLGSDGDWVRHDRDETGAPLIDLQNELMRRIGSRRRGAGR